MRMNIIKRFAAGTIGVCFTYALVRMPFNTINNPIETAADWAAVPTTVSAETTQPATQPTSQQAARAQATEGTTVFQLPEPTTAAAPETTVPSPTEAFTEQLRNEEIITNDDSPESSDENEWVYEQNDTSGDIPTQEQFLRNMTCGGCRHNCLLVNPRCMKGRAKAESATVEYYETYGA